MKFIKSIKKEYLLILLVLIGITSLIIVNKNFSHKETVLDNVRLKYNVTNNKGMAIMLEKEDGSGYEVSKSNTWPTDMVYNSELSGCMDSDGNKIDDSLIYNESTKSVTVRTKKTAYCYLYFDNIKPSVKLTVSTNGVSKTLPTTGGYKANLTCNDATGTFSDKYQRIEISAINNTYSTCNLNYVTQSTSGYTKLSSEITRKQTLTTTNGGICSIESNTTQSACTSAGGYWYTVEEKYAKFLNSNATYTTITDYEGNYTMFKGTYSAESGTSAAGFSPSNGVWTSVPSSMTTNTYYHMLYTIPSGTEEAHYQVCYSTPAQGSYHSYNRLYVYKTGKLNALTSSYISLQSTAVNNECVDVGFLSAGDYINITQRAYKTIAPISFSIRKTTDIERPTAGVRFSGKEPSNYVWFNNEMWRIIGLIPTCTASGCTSSDDLVKIIRNDSIGAYAYDALASGYTGTWGNNTLKKLLNEFYYGKLDGTSNGAGKAYCYGYYNSTYESVSDCNFKTIGISSDSTDYYGRMIENVYWNTGASAYSGTVSAIYGTEVGTQTVPGHVGLMTASDYGYAGTDYSNAMNGSAFANNAGTNWLFGQGYEWTSIQYSSDTSSALFVSNRGKLSNDYACYGFAVRPVVYLDSSVYIISGDGTESNPYIIGM